MKAKWKNKERSYEAQFIFYGWQKSMKRKRYAIARWLRLIARELEEEDPSQYTEGRYTARYVKSTKK